MRHGQPPFRLQHPAPQPTLNTVSHTAEAGALSVSRKRCRLCGMPRASMGFVNLHVRECADVQDT